MEGGSSIHFPHIFSHSFLHVNFTLKIQNLSKSFPLFPPRSLPPSPKNSPHTISIYISNYNVIWCFLKFEFKIFSFLLFIYFIHSSKQIEARVSEDVPIVHTNTLYRVHVYRRRRGGVYDDDDIRAFLMMMWWCDRFVLYICVCASLSLLRGFFLPKHMKRHDWPDNEWTRLIALGSGCLKTYLDSKNYVTTANKCFIHKG